MRPTPGSYRSPLIAGLKTIGEPLLAAEFEQRNIAFAVVTSITGSPTLRRELVDVCIRGLEASGGDAEIVAHYVNQLRTGVAVPAQTAGAFVYDPRDAKAWAHVAASTKVWAPGELFLKS